jgi:hypothetical protein
MLFSNFHIINPCNNWSIAPIIQINTEIKPVNPSETFGITSNFKSSGANANTAISFTRFNRC